MGKRLSLSFLFSVVALGVGFANQLLISGRFGTSAALDGFWVAVSVVNFLGFYAVPLRDAVVPVFHDTLGAKEEASRYAGATLTLGLLLGLAGGLLLLVAVAAGVPGLLVTPAEQGAHVGGMLLWLLPVAVLLATTEVFSGLLAALDMVVRQAVLRLVPPVATFLSLVLLGERLGLHALPVSLVASNVLAIAVAAHALRSRGIQLRLADPRRALVPRARAMLATLVTVYVLAQLHAVMERAVYARAGAGVVSAFQYATALVTALIGLVSVPLASVLWPRFLALQAEGNRTRLASLLGNVVVLVGVPLTVACIFVFRNADAIVHVVYTRGGFGDESARITSMALAFLVFTAVPASLSQVAGRLLNAQGNHRAMGAVSIGMAVTGMTLLGVGAATGRYGLAMAQWLVSNVVGAVLNLYQAWEPIRSREAGSTGALRRAVGPLVVVAAAVAVAPRVTVQGSKLEVLLRLGLHFALYAAVSGAVFGFVFRGRLREWMGRARPA